MPVSRGRTFLLSLTLSLLIHAAGLAALAPAPPGPPAAATVLEVRLAPLRPPGEVSVGSARDSARPSPSPRQSVVARNGRPMAPATAAFTPPGLETEPSAPAAPVPPDAPAAPPAGAVPRARAELVPPAVIADPQPAYPLAARRLGQEGRVLLRAEVLADGSCGVVEVAETSGHPLLDGAALAAVRRWRFVPARRGGEPVAATVEIPVVFRLTDSSADPGG